LLLCGPGLADDVPPLPDRNPMRVPKPKVEKPPLPGELPTVPWTEAEVSAAKAACTTELKDLTLDYEPLSPIKQGSCGAPAPILLKSIGNEPKVVIEPAATITCPVARALAAWLEKSVQPEAKARFGSPVTLLRSAAAYSCRNRNGASVGLLSEHALANAFDVSEFVFASGQRITVGDDWPKVLKPEATAVAKSEQKETDAPESKSESSGSESKSKSGDASKSSVSKPKDSNTSEVTKAEAPAEKPPSPPPVAEEPKPDPTSVFLHKVHDGACQAFGTVLGPDADAAHKSHFHLDMKERKRKSFCQ
jgi:hypothetical protein